MATCDDRLMTNDPADVAEKLVSRPSWRTRRNMALSFRSVTMSMMGVVIGVSLPDVGLVMGAVVVISAIGLRARLQRSGMSLPLVIAGAATVGAASARMLIH